MSKEEICYADPFGITKCSCSKCKKKEETKNANGKDKSDL